MTWRNTAEKYGLAAIGIHWVFAALFIGLLALGLYMADLAPGPDKLKLYALHKSFGIAVLALAILRLLWRFINQRPQALATHRPWEKILAKTTHIFLYVVVFVMPLTGWIGSSAKGYGVSVLGWFTMPDLVGQNKELGKLCYEIHEIVAWAAIGLIALHAAGALKHHIIDRDGTLRRMLPLLAFALFLHIPSAHAETWVIDHEQSSLTFDGTQMGVAFMGTFGAFGGEIFFDSSNPAEGRATIKIDMTRIATGSEDRDAYIGKPEWFDSISFPESTYVIGSFEKKGENQYIAHGNLTLKNITLPVDLPFRLTVETDPAGNKIANVDGEVTLKRLDFGIGSGEWTDTDTVENEVIVRISLVALAESPDVPGNPAQP